MTLVLTSLGGTPNGADHWSVPHNKWAPPLRSLSLSLWWPRHYSMTMTGGAPIGRDHWSLPGHRFSCNPCWSSSPCFNAAGSASQNAAGTCSHIPSCISVKVLHPKKPGRPCHAAGYLSELVLLSWPPAPRSHLGPRRTSRRSDSPGSSSSLHGGSRPAYRQPSSLRCPLRCYSQKSDETEASSNAAAMTADVSWLFRTAKIWRLIAAAEYLQWKGRVCALLVLERAEPVSLRSPPIRRWAAWAHRKREEGGCGQRHVHTLVTAFCPPGLSTTDLKTF